MLAFALWSLPIALRFTEKRGSPPQHYSTPGHTYSTWALGARLRSAGFIHTAACMLRKPYESLQGYVTPGLARRMFLSNDDEKVKGDSSDPNPRAGRWLKASFSQTQDMWFQ